MLLGASNASGDDWPISASQMPSSFLCIRMASCEANEQAPQPTQKPPSTTALTDRMPKTASRLIGSAAMLTASHGRRNAGATHPEEDKTICRHLIYCVAGGKNRRRA